MPRPIRLTAYPLVYQELVETVMRDGGRRVCIRRQSKREADKLRLAFYGFRRALFNSTDESMLRMKLLADGVQVEVIPNVEAIKQPSVTVPHDVVFSPRELSDEAMAIQLALRSNDDETESQY